MASTADGPGSWPTDKPWLKPVLSVFYLVVLCLTTQLVCHRVQQIGISRLRHLHFPRALILAILFLAWLVAFLTNFLIFGIGSAYSLAACNATVYLAITMYSLTKLCVYTYLMERVYVVHTSNALLEGPWYDRFEVRWYLGGLLHMLGFAISIEEAFRHKKAYITDTNMCFVGIDRVGIIPALTVDISFNVYLTLAFVVPLWKTSFTGARELVKRSCGATAVTTVISVTSLTIVLIWGDNILASLLNSICLMDTAGSALAFALTTSGKPAQDRTDSDQRPPAGLKAWSETASRSRQVTVQLPAEKIDDEVESQSV